MAVSKLSRLRPKAASEAARSDQLQGSAQASLNEAQQLERQIVSLQNQFASLTGQIDSLSTALLNPDLSSGEIQSIQNQINTLSGQRTTVNQQISSTTSTQNNLINTGNTLSERAISIINNLPELPNLSIRGVLPRQRLTAARRSGTRGFGTILSSPASRTRGLIAGGDARPSILGF